MAERNIFVEVVDGDQLNDGYFNDIYGQTFQQNLFGDGSDGAATISSNTDLGTTIKQYTDLTIDNTFTLSADFAKIFVSGTLTVNGTIKSKQ